MQAEESRIWCLVCPSSENGSCKCLYSSPSLAKNLAELQSLTSNSENLKCGFLSWQGAFRAGSGERSTLLDSLREGVSPWDRFSAKLAGRLLSMERVRPDVQTCYLSRALQNVRWNHWRHGATRIYEVQRRPNAISRHYKAAWEFQSVRKGV